MAAGDGLLLLAALTVAALFTGLVLLGCEYFRLAQREADGSHLTSLIELEGTARRIEAGAGQLLQQLQESRQELREVARRLQALGDNSEDVREPRA